MCDRTVSLKSSKAYKGAIVLSGIDRDVYSICAVEFKSEPILLRDDSWTGSVNPWPVLMDQDEIGNVTRRSTGALPIGTSSTLTSDPSDWLSRFPLSATNGWSNGWSGSAPSFT